MTDVEKHSTTPPLQGRTVSVLRPIALGGVAVTLLSSALLSSSGGSAAGDTLSSARAQAAQIVSQLQADAARVDELSQQYESAQQHEAQIDSQIEQIRAAVASDAAQVQADQGNLRRQAIDAYVASGNDGELESLFAAEGQDAAVADEYRNVASGNISDSIDNLDVAQRALLARQQQLQAAQAQAQAALDAVASARQAAEEVVANQQATLAGLKGRIAGLVAQQQAQQQAAQHAAFVTRAAVPQSLPVLPSAGGGSAAVRAAESQIGVPYRWGGEQPGVGFDCSGLTQWSWGQAGVSIPRTAQAQYDAIAHESLGSLEPGDLLFWGYGTGDIYHVAMYVGGGEIVQAPETGEDVQITPIWNNNLVGAGRP